MSEKQIDRALAGAIRSMEIEGFSIDKTLREKGKSILRGETTADILVDKYIQSLKGKHHRI